MLDWEAGENSIDALRLAIGDVCTLPPAEPKSDAERQQHCERQQKLWIHFLVGTFTPTLNQRRVREI